MVDMSIFGGLFTGFKAATDISKALLELKVEAEVRDKVIALQTAIMGAQQNAMEAQQEQVALAKRVDDLERELAAYKAWDTEKQRYELKALARGSFAYVLKPEASKDGEPEHWLCANCFQDGKKRILQAGNIVMRIRAYNCPSCQASIQVGGQAATIA